MAGTQGTAGGRDANGKATGQGKGAGTARGAAVAGGGRRGDPKQEKDLRPEDYLPDDTDRWGDDDNPAPQCLR